MITAHLSGTHPTPNQRLSMKDNPTQISYFSAYHPVKAALLICICLASLSTLNLVHHPLICSISHRFSTDTEELQPTGTQPNLSSPSAQQEYFKPRYSCGSSKFSGGMHPGRSAPSGNWSPLFPRHTGLTLQNHSQVIS